ncbi:response regulator [Noviherbaspirillum sp.]|uniref:response regulator n=1 Tax=Noviherbaspirillum sp. TaxID=1926288 RepID=UPI002D687F6B|nr:response regulator [Noviherbaspirillum sp.]HZW21750.1 response regulator [Noviherbaspirillum sp.]
MAGKRLLVIEDDPANLRLMLLLLNAAGYQATGVASGGEGLEAARRAPPDLILCDGRMPDMTGVEVARHIRADEATADIPMIAVTGLVRTGDTGQLFEAGFNGFIAKPFDIKAFVSQVSAFLGGAGK